MKKFYTTSIHSIGNYLWKTGTKAFVIALISCMGVMPSSAQEEKEYPEMETDRPDQTESSTVVPKGTLQGEIGLTWERETITTAIGDSKQQTFTLPTLLLRYGVTESFEMRMIIENFASRTKLPEGRETMKNGLNDLALGAKFQLARETGLLPEIALNVHMHLPGDTTIGRPNVSAPEFRFLISHSINDFLDFGVNLGMEWDGISPEGAYTYTATIGADFTDTFGGYIEVFGVEPLDGTDVGMAFDGGFRYLLQPNLQLDLSAGVPLNDNGTPFYIAIGASMRIPH